MGTRSHSRRARTCAAGLLLAALIAVPADAGFEDCSQPLSSGDRPVTSDCLAVLQSAVRIRFCRLCICDTRGNGIVAASDALLCLKKTVDDNIELTCNPCIDTTTTTTTSTSSSTTTTSFGPTSSTSTSSTSSTTTTIQIPCSNDGPCAEFPGSRCNPNTDICEIFPCTEDDDCHLFFECDLDSGFCDDPQ